MGGNFFTMLVRNRRIITTLSDSPKVLMGEESNSPIRSAVLRLVHSQERTFGELIKELAEHRIDEASVKAAVLRLSSEGTIEITPDWKIRSVTVGSGSK